MSRPLFKAEATKDFIETFAKTTKGVSVSYSDVTEPVATGDGSLILPQPTLLNEEQWHGQVHKELSYLMEDNRFLFNAQRIYKEGSPHHLAASIIADHIAERRDYGEYIGRSKFVAQNRSRISTEVVEAAGDLDPAVLTPESEMLRSLMEYDNRTRKSWMEHGSIRGIRPMNNCQYLGNLEKAFGTEGFPQVKTESDFHKLVEQAVHVLEEPPEPEYQQGEGDSSESEEKEGNSNGQGNQDDGRGESQEGEAQEGEGSGEGQEAEGAEGDQGEGQGEEEAEGDGGDAQERSEKDVRNYSKGSGADNVGGIGSAQESKPNRELVELIQKNFKDVQKSLNNRKAKDTDREKQEKQRYNYQDLSSYKPVTHRRIIDGKLLDQGTGGSNNWRSILETASQYPISKKLRKYLLVLQTSSYSYGLESGKVDNARLYRVGLKERKPRVFKQKQSSRLQLNTAVQVLIDCSGSMYGRKEFVASTIGVCVYDVLKAIQVPYELLGFSDGSGLDHMVFKDFTENLNREHLAKRLCSRYKESGCNSDGDSIMWAAERLSLRPEENKVLIVLSDGQPAGSYTGDGRKYLKYVCESIEGNSPINLWGIGILTDAPEKYYRNNYICRELSQLEPAVLGVLKKSVVKNKGNNRR